MHAFCPNKYGYLLCEVMDPIQYTWQSIQAQELKNMNGDVNCKIKKDSKNS